MGEQAGRTGGLLSSVRQFASTLVGVVCTRVELFATELDEERARIALSLWMAVIGALFLGLGLLLAALFVVVLFWDSHRLLVLGLLAAGFIAAGAAVVLALRVRLAQRSRLFTQTLEELRRDQDRLNR